MATTAIVNINELYELLGEVYITLEHVAKKSGVPPTYARRLNEKVYKNMENLKEVQNSFMFRVT